MDKHVTQSEDSGEEIWGIIGLNWYKTRTAEPLPKGIRPQNTESQRLIMVMVTATMCSKRMTLSCDDTALLSLWTAHHNKQ